MDRVCRISPDSRMPARALRTVSAQSISRSIAQPHGHTAVGSQNDGDENPQSRWRGTSVTPSARMAGILERERSETVELAEAISLASLIEPRLIRAMRLGLFRRFHTAVEADLWFSRFVHSRAVDGVVLDPELAGELRLRLRDSGRLDASWEIVKRIHTNT